MEEVETSEEDDQTFIGDEEFIQTMSNIQMKKMINISNFYIEVEDAQINEEEVATISNAKVVTNLVTRLVNVGISKTSATILDMPMKQSKKRGAIKILCCLLAKEIISKVCGMLIVVLVNT